jgi:hypothetical protein
VDPCTVDSKLDDGSTDKPVPRGFGDESKLDSSVEEGDDDDASMPARGAVRRSRWCKSGGAACVCMCVCVCVCVLCAYLATSRCSASPLCLICRSMSLLAAAVPSSSPAKLQSPLPTASWSFAGGEFLAVAIAAGASHSAAVSGPSLRASRWLCDGGGSATVCLTASVPCCAFASPNSCGVCRGRRAVHLGLL